MKERSWRWVWQPDLGEGAEQFSFRVTDRGAQSNSASASPIAGSKRAVR